MIIVWLRCFLPHLLLQSLTLTAGLWERALRRRQKNAQHGRYFSPDVQEEIKNGGFDIQKLEPKDMNVTVLFTDIVNFTHLSEIMSLSDVLVLLSDYQSIMIEAMNKKFENLNKK